MTTIDTPPVDAEVAALRAELAELRALIAGVGGARVTREPLTYERHGQHSYFRDCAVLAHRNDPDCAARLQRHAQEMDVLARDHDARARRGLDRAGIETRVTPNRTDGQGGWFSPPAWIVEAFATAPRTGRVLAALMPQFDLPANVGQIAVPYLSTGNNEGPGADNSPAPETDVVDGLDQSPVASIAGFADSSLQLLEQSPAGAHLDWAFFKDLDEAYSQSLEAQLIYGNGTATTAGPGNGQLIGIISRTAANAPAIVPYTSGSPTDVGLYNVMGKAMARVGNNRKQPPEAWLMRTARWAWMGASTDGTRPFNLPVSYAPVPDRTAGYLVGGIFGVPVYLDDQIPQTFSNQAQQPTPGGTQDTIVACRPSDLLLLEGAPRVGVFREPLSGTLGVRLRLDRYVAAITGRRISGVAFIVDTGMVVQSGYNT